MNPDLTVSPTVSATSSLSNTTGSTTCTGSTSSNISNSASQSLSSGSTAYNTINTVGSTSIGTASNSGNSYWTTWTSPYVNISDGSIYMTSNDYSGLGKLFANCLTEKELDTLLDSVKTKAPEDMFRDAVYSIIRNRHCSEEFILKYLDFGNANNIDSFKTLLFVNHEADILSGNYAQIALYLTLS